MDVQRDGNVYYIVGQDGARKVSRGDAERLALASLTPDQQAAHDMALARAARAVDPYAAPAGLDAEYPTALECLQACGTDFDVVPESLRRRDEAGVASKVDGWRAIVRVVAGTLGVVLHVATDAYEIVLQRVALALLDVAAAAGRIRYRYSWMSTDQVRVRAIGVERAHNVAVVGRRVGIRFDLPGLSAFSGRVQAGGTLVTSHDGSTAIRATACLTFAGVSVFHLHTASWRHTSRVAERLTQSNEALDYLARAARGLIRDAEATLNVPDDEAADVVLHALAPELFESVTEAAVPDKAERATAQQERDEKLAASRKRLVDGAALLADAHKDVYLGGFRFVLAAPGFASNREISMQSYYDGLARERMTTALLALARHSGLVNAGMVPENVVTTVNGGAS